ncbi:MAG TPA: Fur family transcriptional regulator [Candidatus Binatia bacterium]|jgi:Fe2+ or Zn2+ uptake regulation protein|nr:Fur family transcriptional regulator [Candidatus Binatia bacterium]
MKTAKDILTGLKAEGSKMTRVRAAAVEAFARHPAPMTAQDLGASLSRAGVAVNKTTLYREIAFLLEKGVVAEIVFGDRTARYELKDREHHHHVVCVRCESVVDVDLDEDLEAQAKIIARKTKFTVLRHSLEFFGLCASCK